MEGIPKSYRIRAGTTDVGREYEIKIAALLSLRCINNAGIQNMWLMMNADGCGAFDDVILSFEDGNRKNITYLIQLKHTMKPTSLKRKEFLKDKGNFYLPKYYNSIKDIKREIDAESCTKSDLMKHLDRNRNSMIYVLFTTRGSSEGDYLINISKTSNEESSWLLHECINTNGEIFSFNYAKLNFAVEEKYRHLMDNFYLFTKQIAEEKIDVLIQNCIENLIKPMTLSTLVMDEVYQKFILFLSHWSKGNMGGFYPLTKTVILKVLFESLIKQYMWNFVESRPNDEVCCDSISLVPISVTIIQNDGVVMEFLRNQLHRSIQEYLDVKENKVLWENHPEIISKAILRTIGEGTNISVETAYDFLWKTSTLPVILAAPDIKNYKFLLQLLKIFRGLFKVILLTEHVPDTSDNLEKCSSLKDLSESDRLFILNYQVRLQNRKFVQLTSFIQPENFHLITIKDIIYILMGQFSIGDSPPPTPEIFIPQSFDSIWMKWDVLKKAISEKFVIHCWSPDDVNVLLNKAGMSLEDISVWHPNVPHLSTCRIIIAFNFCEIAEIVKKWHNFNTHFLMFHECHELEWINTCGVHTGIFGYRKVRDCQCLYHHRTFADFHSVLKVMSPECIIISAYPGMGKSVMLAHISNMAPTDRWLLTVNLLDHTCYYKQKLTSVDHIKYFAQDSITNPLAQLVFDLHVKSKKVMVLFDGFDEVPMNLQKKVVKMVLECKDLGCSIYLTTRTNMQPLLEDSLQTFARSITPFSHQDQLQYLTDYFTSHCSSGVGTGELIGDFSRNLLEEASYNLIDRDREFTGIPLQTKLLCEVFKKDCDNYLRTKSFEHKPFDLIYLYKHFIRQKFIIACEKLGKGFEDTLNTLEEGRTLYALQSIFLKEDLEGLNIDKRLKEILQVLPHHQLQKDGIIVVRNDTEVRFIHRTFAEYLVAKWLSKNVKYEREKKITVSLAKKIFDFNFFAVRNIFDRLMAKNSPLHLAIIYRDANSVKSILKTKEHSLLPLGLDRGGRSPFHLLSSWINFSSTSSMFDILNLLGKVECKTDRILNFNPIQYALLDENFWLANFFYSRLETFDKYDIGEEWDILMRDKWPNNCQYPHLGLVYLLRKVTNKLSLKEHVCYEQISDKFGFTRLHLASIYGQSQVIRELLQQNADVNACDNSGKTPLHWAALKGHLNAVKVLLCNSANVNKADKSRKTVLHYLFMLNVERDYEIITLLLENNGNLNKKDKYGYPVLYYAFHFNRQKFMAHLPAINANLTHCNLSLTDVVGRNFGNVLNWAGNVGEEDTVKHLLEPNW